jgi:hypothetical protein
VGAGDPCSTARAWNTINTRVDLLSEKRTRASGAVARTHRRPEVHETGTRVCGALTEAIPRGKASCSVPTLFGGSCDRMLTNGHTELILSRDWSNTDKHAQTREIAEGTLPAGDRRSQGTRSADPQGCYRDSSEGQTRARWSSRLGRTLAGTKPINEIG